MHYDVFNGDADGIIALLQLRFAEPKESELITGVKRDIQLLDQVVLKDDVTSVTVLDISLDKNSQALEQLLHRDVNVFYCDHHQASEIPVSPILDTLINLDADVCTSLLINEKLKGQFATWAVAAAFGDNLFNSAYALAKTLSLSEEDTEFLKELGTLINYNGYGSSLADLHFPPAELYRNLLNYKCPLMLREDRNSPYYTLKEGFAADHTFVTSITPVIASSKVRVFELPNQPWARRMSGIFGNTLANQQPDLAHAILTLNPNQSDFTVSIRAPLSNRVGADEICSSFPTGGGRKAAAGINQLPLTCKTHFIEVFEHYYNSL